MRIDRDTQRQIDRYIQRDVESEIKSNAGILKNTGADKDEN